MKYSTHQLGSYNLHMIKTDQFKTITVKVNFRRDVKKEEITIRNMLSDILLKSTKKYHSERLLGIATEDLYGIAYAGTTTISGSYNILSFEFMFLQDMYTEEGNFDKSMSFISDVLFRPNVQNGKFTTEEFTQSKQFFTQMISSLKENPNRYSINRMFEEMSKESPISYRADGYIEDIDKITEASLYTYYESVIKRDAVDIFIIGNIDEYKVKRMIERDFTFNTFKKHPHSHYITDNKVRIRNNIVIEKGTNSQSNLIIGANLAGITSFEGNYVSYIYSYILGGGANSKLFQSLREENSLCYYASSSIYRLNQILLIQTGIDKDNYKKAVSLIKKQIKNMAAGKFTLDEMTEAQVTYIAGLKEIMDSPDAILNMYIGKEYLDIDLIDERIQKIGNVKKADVIAFAKKVKLNTIYLLEGGVQNGEDHTS